MASVQNRHQGQASGAYNSIRELGGVFGVAVLGAIFQHVATTPAQFMDGFRIALHAGVVIVLVGAAAGTFLPQREGRAVARASRALAGSEG